MADFVHPLPKRPKATTESNDVIVQEINEEVNKLKMSREQLRCSGVPIRVTAEVIRQARNNIKRLQLVIRPSHKGYRRVMSEVQATHKLIGEVMDRLDILDPDYATPPEMTKYAKQVRCLLEEALDTALRDSDVRCDRRAKILNGLLRRLEGSRVSEASANEKWLLQGLLTGMSTEEVVKMVTKPKRKKGVRELLDTVGYEALRFYFNPWTEWKDLGVPEAFKEQRVQERVSAIPMGCDPFETNDPYIPLDHINFERLLQTDRLANQTAVESPGECALSPYLSLLGWRLKAARCPQQQRTRILGQVEAGLRNRRWLACDGAEEVFVAGLLKGENRWRIEQQCKRPADHAMLSDMLDRIDLQGLQLGRDWVWSPSGTLRKAGSAHFNNTLDQIAASGTQSPYRYTVTSSWPEYCEDATERDEKDITFHDCGGDKSAFQMLMEEDDSDYDWEDESSLQLPRELTESLMGM